jgi:hypothetical protein
MVTYYVFEILNNIKYSKYLTFEATAAYENTFARRGEKDLYFILFWKWKRHNKYP